jgi:hypothetical protein
LAARVPQTSHDQHFKHLLRTFFRPFLAAFVPELHRDLGPEAIVFLDKELIRDQRGRRRTKLVDLVARVRLRGEASFVLVHVEHQARRDPRIGWRLLCYAIRLMEDYGLPVYPILLTSYDRPTVPEPDRFVMEVREFRVVEFRFRVVQLNRLNWRAFVRLKNPAATALMARMRIKPEDRVRVKLQLLRLLATWRLDRKKMDLIAGFADSYLALTAKEELALQREVDKLPESKRKASVMELMTSWERKGRAEGRREGELAVIKRLLKLRLGVAGPELDRKLNRLSVARLEELAEALLGFDNLADLERWLAEGRKNGVPA